MPSTRKRSTCRRRFTCCVRRLRYCLSLSFLLSLTVSCHFHAKNLFSFSSSFLLFHVPVCLTANSLTCNTLCPRDVLHANHVCASQNLQELELRIETQKQTLSSRDESIKKLMEAMQSKGISSKMMEEERMEMERLRTRNIELETRMRHLESMAEIKDKDAYKVSYIYSTRLFIIAILLCSASQCSSHEDC